MSDLITNQFLEDHGFTYRKCGICGQDSWAGLAFWTHEQDQSLVMRGDCPDLKLAGFSNSYFKFEEDIILILKIFGIRYEES